MIAVVLAVTMAATGLTAEVRRELALTLTEQGFTPADVRVQKGEPLRLVITRKAAGGCATEIQVRDAGVRQELPLGKPVQLDFTPQHSGELRYACAVGRHGGVLLIE